MTPDQEKQLLQALYDRLFDAITYTPSSGASNPFDRKETFIHFTKNEALNPADFKEIWSPTNPNADLGTSERFARMVDKISTMSLEWQPKDQPLSETYASIVRGANEAKAARPSEGAIAAYNKAYEYLHPKEINPFTGKESAGGVSKEYEEYQKNLTALSDAYADYSTAYNGYVDALVDAKDENGKRKAQRDWQAKERPLRREIDRVQTAITVGNGRYVQMALDTMNTTINDALARALQLAKAQVDDGQFNGGTAGVGWLLTYASPSNWYDQAAVANFSQLTISSRNKSDDKTSTSHAYTFGASYNAGLWGVSAQSEGSFTDSRHHTDADDLEISCNIAKVNIIRPWFNEFLFRSRNWWTNLGDNTDILYISNGKIDSSNADKILPMYPVAFIVARDLVIKGSFSKTDEQYISQAISAKASVNYGPFSIGGSYKYGHEEEHMKSSFDAGTIKVPGIQIIGWVSRLLPPCPTQSRAELDK